MDIPGALRALAGGCTPGEPEGRGRSAFATPWTERTRVTTVIPAPAAPTVRAMPKPSATPARSTSASYLPPPAPRPAARATGSGVA